MRRSVQQLENRRLHGDVERRGRLVEDQQARLRREAAGDPDARLLSAGQLMRIALQQLAAERDAVGELTHPVGHVAQPDETPQRIGDRGEGGHVRREILRGVLEDVLDVPPLRPVHECRRRDRADVGALEQDLPGAGIDQARDEAAERALARSAFADDAETFPLGEIEADVVDRDNRACLPSAPLEDLAEAGDVSTADACTRRSGATRQTAAEPRRNRLHAAGSASRTGTEERTGQIRKLSRNDVEIVGRAACCGVAARSWAA